MSATDAEGVFSAAADADDVGNIDSAAAAAIPTSAEGASADMRNREIKLSHLPPVLLTLVVDCLADADFPAVFAAHRRLNALATDDATADALWRPHFARLSKAYAQRGCIWCHNKWPCQTCNFDETYTYYGEAMDENSVLSADPRLRAHAPQETVYQRYRGLHRFVRTVRAAIRCPERCAQLEVDEQHYYMLRFFESGERETLDDQLYDPAECTEARVHKAVMQWLESEFESGVYRMLVPFLNDEVDIGLTTSSGTIGSLIESVVDIANAEADADGLQRREEYAQRQEEARRVTKRRKKEARVS
jgi:hypothetical protein